ncbi:MAG: YoaK family protein [Rhodomicrobium sp.]
MAGTDGNLGRQLPSGQHTYALAASLAGLAGWVDAIALVQWHLYVSFMSGNSTAIGASASATNWPTFLNVSGVLVAFIFGVVSGELLSRAGRVQYGSLVLLIEALLLGIASGLTYLRVAAALPVLLLAIAMGIQNASVHRAGGISVALTYVTGTLVHAGRALAAALAGDGSWRSALPYLGLWLSLIGGAVAGAVLAQHSVPGAIGLGGLFALSLAATSAAGIGLTGNE